jgi:AbrB family looped-hinge helix DNA binding protein
LKQYQVTKKLQVTIPKKLADKAGILPGDSVIFDEAGGEITLRKAGTQRRSAKELGRAIDEFASDMKKIGPRIEEAERELNASLSGHLRAK